ncbi:MAG TPA: (deoxy)nucleoside triphosphate pyrophosphohydrolase [bacterium]
MERLKTPHYLVTAAIIVGDGKILITQRPFHDAFGGLWEFPGGKQEQGESLEQCLVREIYEELAVTIQIHEHLFSITHRYEKLKISLHFFLCTILNGAPTCKDVQDWKWVDRSEFDNFPFAKADQKALVKLNEIWKQFNFETLSRQKSQIIT